MEVPPILENDCSRLADRIIDVVAHYKGDDLPGQVVSLLQPVFVDLKSARELLVKEGPLNAERWTLDQLLEDLLRWKARASGRTCVSFENICYGASSLWHQTHRENFREVDRKPEALSRWVLSHTGILQDAFPAQVLLILESLHEENTKLKLERANAAKPGQVEDSETVAPNTEGTGVNRLGNAILCQASGETDVPAVLLCHTAAEIRSFFLHEWLGEECEDLDFAMTRLANHDWANGPLTWDFEIGSCSLEDVHRKEVATLKTEEKTPSP